MAQLRPPDVRAARFAETLWVRRAGLTIYSEQRQLSDFLAHAAIADAIGTRDADTAERLMRDHISYAMGLLLEHVDVEAPAAR